MVLPFPPSLVLAAHPLQHGPERGGLLCSWSSTLGRGSPGDAHTQGMAVGGKSPPVQPQLHAQSCSLAPGLQHPHPTCSAWCPSPPEQWLTEGRHLPREPPTEPRGIGGAEALWAGIAAGRKPEGSLPGLQGSVLPRSSSHRSRAASQVVPV